MLVDQVKVIAQAGTGRRGSIRIRPGREIAKSGPDAGAGKKSGNVILRADRHVDNLANLFYEPLIKAKNGGHGMGKKMTGRAGADKIVKVPVGTVIWRAEQTRSVIVSKAEGPRETTSTVPPQDSSTSLGMTGEEAIVDFPHYEEEFV